MYTNCLYTQSTIRTQLDESKGFPPQQSYHSTLVISVPRSWIVGCELFFFGIKIKT